MHTRRDSARSIYTKIPYINSDTLCISIINLFKTKTRHFSFLDQGKSRIVDVIIKNYVDSQLNQVITNASALGNPKTKLFRHLQA